MADDLRQYPPTTRRLRKFHEAGIFPYSQVLTAAIIFLAFSGPWSLASAFASRISVKSIVAFAFTERWLSGGVISRIFLKFSAETEFWKVR